MSELPSGGRGRERAAEEMQEIIIITSWKRILELIEYGLH